MSAQPSTRPESAQPATRPECNQPTDPADRIAADQQFYRGVLQELITLGLDLVRLNNRQANAQAGIASDAAPANPAAPGDAAATAAAAATTAATIAYERLTRALRRNIVLANKLDQPPAPRPDPEKYRVAARKRIIRESEDLIQRRCVYESDVEDLRVELRERLDGPDIEDDLATRPIDEIITEICRDLGMAAIPGTQPWARRDPEHIAELCAYAATPRKTNPPETNPPEPDPAKPDPAEPPETLQLNPTRFRGK